MIVCLFGCLFVCLSVCLFVYLFICLIGCSFVCLFDWLFVCLVGRLFVSFAGIFAFSRGDGGVFCCRRSAGGCARERDREQPRNALGARGRCARKRRADLRASLGGMRGDAMQRRAAGCNVTRQDATEHAIPSTRSAAQRKRGCNDGRRPTRTSMCHRRASRRPSRCKRCDRPRRNATTCSRRHLGLRLARSRTTQLLTRPARAGGRAGAAPRLCRWTRARTEASPSSAPADGSKLV